MKIVKRSGAEVEFERQKIVNAITLANSEINPKDRISDSDIARIADAVVAECERQNRVVSVEDVQDIVQHEPYPVESKARDIIRQLKEHGITRFLLLFRGSRSRSEVVATFLAVLELCRARVLRLAGSETDCTVRQEGELPENLTL